MGISRRPKGDKNASAGESAQSGKPNIQKAQFDTTKKKEVGVSDLTLIMGIYTDAVLDSYKGKNRLEMPPHVFAVAESAYYNMNAYKDNQCVIISGESGAGKTEAAKRIMQYVANVSGGSNSSIQEIKDMVLATNPLLESFGNAKTLRNNNSSRFGKYLQLQFNAQGEPVGADITNYLLEKTRVVTQIKDERNFHIFYQFTKGASQSYRENYGIQQPSQYVYTSRAECFDVDGIDDLAEYQDTLDAMKIIGLSQAEQDEIFRMLAAILWTGNIQFREDDDGYATVVDQSVVDFLAYLLDVDAGHVIQAITIRILTPRNGEVIESPANVPQAIATRDALAKSIYSNLFDWIVERVNKSLIARAETSNSIGILDIYGFEIFEKNSFEQLCINYVNEKLQQIFIQLTLKTEQEEYAREQIHWTPIKYFDNKVVCDLIEAVRPPGVFSAMKDATKTAHADPAACDRTFMQAISGMSNPHLTPRQGNFIIKHYAGDVSYTVEGITDKNKDQLLKGLLNLFGQSKNHFIHELFPHQVDQDNRKQPPSAGDKIKASANDLVATLMKATPSYIRTIKPNENKSPTEYNEKNVLHQVKYLGLQENVRIRRAGFAYRQTFDKFVERFYLLSPKTSYAGDYIWTGESKTGAMQILKDTNIPTEEFQMGVTKAFIKAPETLFALEHMRDRYWHNMAARIQRVWRAFLQIRIEAATRIQRMFRKKREGKEFLELREKGHQVLQGRKERRRYSLVGSRRFMGDYLGIAATTGPGSKIRGSINLPANEVTLFSCRGEILETKFGRSSKLSPRIFIMTRAKFYIVSQQLVNKQVQIALEKAIPLGAIKFVSVSTSRDDWFSLGVGSPQEADPLLTCVFKTELLTHMQGAMPGGGFNLKIGDSIEYAKKPGKIQLIKVVKDSQQHQDHYKSHTIHTQAGEPPNSRSKPMPKGKPVEAKPFTKGRLIKPGGPGGRPSKLTNGNRPTPKPVPALAAARHVLTPAAARPVPAANPVAASIPVHTRNPSAQSTKSNRAMPPPPPPAPPAPPPAPVLREPQYRVLYAFAGQSANEFSLKQGEIVTVLQKETNGWWLTKNVRGQGWAPTAYLEEVAPPPPVAARPTPPPPPPPGPPKMNGTNGAAIRSKPTPPAPPAKRPAAGRKPAPPPAPRDSGMSISSNGSGNNSGRSTPTPSLAGGLAEALRARQSAMQGNTKKEDEDDW
ncbi:myosin-5 [Sclerotinia borealis F-4128]|uniref:Myosin-1 n=1 Tax=Sclerotinia borealis (strain F-4128) TaxID=1432307 RepID=W9C674_SCLBF|nr:myosin-5 [Sclerotinia borealis F-4128]